METTNQKPSHIGVGLYTLAGAARLIHAPLENVRRWASPDDSLVSRVFHPSERTITFVELMELYFIKMFRDEGVTLQTIRRASKAAAAKYDTAYPFSVKRFDTDGKSIFATLRQSTKNETLIEDLEKSQLVFVKIMRPFFRKLEYGPSAEIARFWPRSKRGRVVLDPTRKFGKPIDSETGIPTRVIVDAISAGNGQSPEVVARSLGIPLTAVNAAVAFERSLAV
jgi:uncharacterized protein (DUF433 family)